MSTLKKILKKIMLGLVGAFIGFGLGIGVGVGIFLVLCEPAGGIETGAPESFIYTAAWVFAMATLGFLYCRKTKTATWFKSGTIVGAVLTICLLLLWEVIWPPLPPLPPPSQFALEIENERNIITIKCIEGKVKKVLYGPGPTAENASWEALELWVNLKRVPAHVVYFLSKGVPVGDENEDLPGVQFTGPKAMVAGDVLKIRVDPPLAVGDMVWLALVPWHEMLWKEVL